MFKFKDRLNGSWLAGRSFTFFGEPVTDPKILSKLEFICKKNGLIPGSELETQHLQETLDGIKEKYATSDNFDLAQFLDTVIENDIEYFEEDIQHFMDITGRHDEEFEQQLRANIQPASKGAAYRCDYIMEFLDFSERTLERASNIKGYRRAMLAGHLFDSKEEFEEKMFAYIDNSDVRYEKALNRYWAEVLDPVFAQKKDYIEGIKETVEENINYDVDEWREEIWAGDMGGAPDRLFHFITDHLSKYGTSDDARKEDNLRKIFERKMDRMNPHILLEKQIKQEEKEARKQKKKRKSKKSNKKTNGTAASICPEDAQLAKIHEQAKADMDKVKTLIKERGKKQRQLERELKNVKRNYKKKLSHVQEEHEKAQKLLSDLETLKECMQEESLSLRKMHRVDPAHIALIKQETLIEDEPVSTAKPNVNIYDMEEAELKKLEQVNKKKAQEIRVLKEDVERRYEEFQKIRNHNGDLISLIKGHKSQTQDFTKYESALEQAQKDIKIAIDQAEYWLENPQKAPQMQESFEEAAYPPLTELGPWAKANLKHIIIHGNAIKAAKKAVFEDTDLVYQCLEFLDRDAARHIERAKYPENFTEDLSQLFFNEAKELGVEFSVRGLGPRGRSKKLIEKYTILHEGHEYEMIDHLKKGKTKDDRKDLRIYYERLDNTKEDPDDYKILVGHLPNHLPMNY